MVSILIPFLLRDPAIRVLYNIVVSPPGRGVRETAELCDLSPRGAQIVLRRLLQEGLIVKEGKGRGARFRSRVSEGDRKFLKQLFLAAQTEDLAARSKVLSKVAWKSVSWIDRTLEAIEETKKAYHGTHPVT